LGDGSAQTTPVTFNTLLITNSAGSGLIGNEQQGTITVTSSVGSNITVTNGTAIDIRRAVGTTSLSMNLNLVSASGGNNGVVLQGVGGTVTAVGGTIDSSAGVNNHVVDVRNATVNFTYPGNINKTTNGYAVFVDNLTTPSGSLSLSGTTTGSNGSLGVIIQNSEGDVSFGTLSLGTSGARFTTTPITITNNSGTVNLGIVNAFSNTATTLNATGNDGTINSTSGNINATNAIAVNIDGPAGLTSLGMTLTSVNASNAANGMLIQDTNGSFTVTGTGVSPSGGTISNTTGHAVSLNNVTNISFTNLRIQNSALSGVYGTEVTNFTFNSGEVDTVGTAASSPELSCWAFNLTQIVASEFLPINNLDGTLTLTNNTCTNPYGGGLDVTNYNGTITNATVTGNTLTSTNNTATSTFGGITFLMNNSPTSVSSLNGATITNNIINNFPSGGGIVVGGNVSEGANTQILGSLATPITISNNTVSGFSNVNRIGTQGILLFISGRGSMYSVINDNDVTNVNGNGISASAFGDVTARVFVTNNTIVANNAVGSQGIGGGPGVDGNFGISGNLYITVTGNNISQTDGNGILLVSREGSSILNADVQNNTVAAPLTGVRPGIRIDSGNATSVDVYVCLNLAGNISAGSGGSQGLGLRKQGTTSTTNDFAVVGMVATATPGVEAYVDGLNPGGNGTLLISATSGFTNCTLP